MVYLQKLAVVFGFTFTGLLCYSILGRFGSSITVIRIDENVVKPQRRCSPSTLDGCPYGYFPLEESPKFHQFKVKLSKHETQVYKEILQTFLHAVEKYNLTYWIYSGSLLGSFRHHGMTPWDDDIDVVMPVNESKILHEALGSLEPHYSLTDGKFRSKFYSHKSQQIRPGLSWKFPFLDISFYVTKDGILHDQDTNYKTFVFRGRDVFPLKRRPFLGFMVNAPRNTEEVLNTTYELQKCRGNRYIHKTERVVKGTVASLNCQELTPFYPFVVRTKTPEGVNETLEFQGQVISWWLDRE